MNIKIKWLTTLTVLALVAGCGDDGKEKDASKVIAKVGEKNITQSEFDALLKFKRVPAQDEEKVERLLEDLLEREALVQQMAKSDYIDSALAAVEVAEFRRQMLISRYFENYLEEIVTEEAIRNFYNSNPDEFQTEKINAAHVLIRTNPAMSENERKALLTKAQEAHSKLMSGMPFEEVVADYSDDKISAKNSGDLGWLKKGAIAPAFSEQAFSLAKGEVSQPFATAFGYHIVKVLEGQKIVKAPFEKVKGDIRYRLRQQAKQAEIERLKAQVKIERVQ